MRPTERGVAEPLPATVRGHVRTAQAGARSAVLSRAQHHRHPAEPGPDRRRGPGLPHLRVRHVLFQPAAFVGDERRWLEDYGDTTGDEVWAQIDAGAGGRLPFRAIQYGDVRCNRTAYGFYLGERGHSILGDEDAADLAVRDVFSRHLGGINFSGTTVPLLAVKVLAARPDRRTHPPAPMWLCVRPKRKASPGSISHFYLDAAIAPGQLDNPRGRGFSVGARRSCGAGVVR